MTQMQMFYVLTEDLVWLKRLRGFIQETNLEHLTTPQALSKIGLSTHAIVLIDGSHSKLPAWADPQWQRWTQDHKILILSSNPNDDEAITALDLGAYGYCHAYCAQETLKQAIEVIASGEIWAGKSLVSRLIKSLRQSLPSSTTTKPKVLTWHTQLTEREREVAQHAAMGQSNAQIAETLDISERTVKAHLTTIFAKLDIADRVQLALRVHGIK